MFLEYVDYQRSGVAVAALQTLKQPSFKIKFLKNINLK